MNTNKILQNLPSSSEKQKNITICSSKIAQKKRNHNKVPRIPLSLSTHSRQKLKILYVRVSFKNVAKSKARKSNGSHHSYSFISNKHSITLDADIRRNLRRKMRERQNSPVNCFSEMKKKTSIIPTSDLHTFEKFSSLEFDLLIFNTFFFTPLYFKYRTSPDDLNVMKNKSDFIFFYFIFLVFRYSRQQLPTRRAFQRLNCSRLIYLAL